MVQTISEAEYHDVLERNADILAEAAMEDTGGAVPDDPQDAVTELAHDILDGHEWFFKRAYGPAAHGCIIEHAETDPSLYSDWQSLSEGDTPEEMLKRLAYMVFEADVVDLARSRVEDAADAEA